MALAETKVVVIALLILAVGFFYTNVRDGTTGYASVQKNVDVEEYGFAAEKDYQAKEIDQVLQIEQPPAPQKKEPTKEVSLQKVFKTAQPIDPCSDNLPPPIRTLVQGAC